MKFIKRKCIFNNGRFSLYNKKQITKEEGEYPPQYGLQIYNGTLNEPSIMNEKHFMECPWVSTDYFETKVMVNNDIIIPFYVTDWEQSEYIKNDTSKSLVLEITKEGEETFKYLVKPGNYDINIGSFKTAGVKSVTIQVTDLTNMVKSHKEVIDIYVIDESYTITEAQTYRMTEQDLVTFGMDNTNNEDETTRIAQSANITTFLETKRNEGYRKVVMLPGTYRMDCQGSRENAVWIPSGLTLDGNGCKIKQHVYYSTGPNDTSACIIRSKKDSFDSHLTNIHIEGDYDEHYLGPRYDDEGRRINEGFEAEGYNGILFGGAFCSMDNVEMSYISSYALGGGSTSMYGTQSMNTEMKARKINLYTGEEEESTEFMTSDFRDMAYFDATGWMNPSDATKFKYLGAGAYSGYFGFSGHTDKYYLFFYDKDKNYLGYEKGLQYAKVPRPDNVKYLRVMIFGEEGYNLPAWGFKLYALDYLENTSVKITNFYAHNTRSCLTYPTYDRVLFKNCRFVNLAEEDDYKVTKWGFDNEDGSYWGRNFYFIDNEFETLPDTTGQRTFNMIHGVNSVFKNNTNLSMLYHWQGAGLFVDGNIPSFKKYNSKTTYGANRFFRISPTSKLKNVAMYEEEYGYDKYKKYASKSVIKNIEIADATLVQSLNSDLNNLTIYYDNCDIVQEYIPGSYGSRFFLSNTACLNCNIIIKESTFSRGENSAYLKGCTISSDVLGENRVLTGEYVVENCTLTNININSYTGEAAFKIKDSTLNNCKSPGAYWSPGSSIFVDNCTINNENSTFFDRKFYQKYYGSTIQNSVFNCINCGVASFDDDREWSPNEPTPEIVPTLILINNTINLSDGRIGITGISNTVPSTHELIIQLKDNVITNDSSLLYPNNVLNNNKIEIRNI